jgi:hypothetical protein
MNDRVVQHYRCPQRYLKFSLTESLSENRGYFRVGPDTVCYGRYSARHPSDSPTDDLYDACQDISSKEGTTYLPFMPSEVADNLRFEQYASPLYNNDSSRTSATAKMYYFIRPLLPVAVRKHLQRVRLNGWREIPFPRWPVDRSVDNLFEHLMLLSLKSQGVSKIPFIWFWPEGAPSCAIMTHDVETATGRDFCSTLMDINDSFGIKSSFQVVPERRYEVTSGYLRSIRDRGFEVNVQDLNHDGHLYRNRKQFLERAAKINSYGREYNAAGFRAGVLYRNQDWYEALDFAYDMSVPNVAHLDPQRGGCCTVTPYFIGKILELPVTTTQDYSLFHILKDYSIDLWRKQTELIMEKHGLSSFIIHPDYIIGDRERNTYETLLSYLAQIRDKMGVWLPTPFEVNRWWRQRDQMTLVEGQEGGWRIEGEGRERARVAYASEKDGRIAFTIENSFVTK